MNTPQLGRCEPATMHSEMRVHWSPSILCIKKLCAGSPAVTRFIDGSSEDFTPTRPSITLVSVPASAWSANPRNGRELANTVGSPWQLAPPIAQEAWRIGFTSLPNDTLGVNRSVADTYRGQPPATPASEPEDEDAHPSERRASPKAVESSLMRNQHRVLRCDEKAARRGQRQSDRLAQLSG